MSRQLRAAACYSVAIGLALIGFHATVGAQAPRFASPVLPGIAEPTATLPAEPEPAPQISPEQVNERLQNLERQNQNLTRRLELQDQQLRELDQKSQPPGQPKTQEKKVE